MYEIWSLGCKPFEELTNVKVTKLALHIRICMVAWLAMYVTICATFLLCIYHDLKTLKKIDDGFRLPPPPGCPRTIYRVMVKCWYVE